MSKTIANQITPSQVSGRLATWHRVMEEKGLTYDDLQTPIDYPELRIRLLRYWQAGCPEIFTASGGNLSEWQSFWQRHGIKADFSGLVIPAKKKGFDRLLVIPQGLTINQAIAICREKFTVWTYTDDLDQAITRNDRTPNQKAYAVWVRDRVEADEELKNLSADDLKKKDVQGITLLERLVYELKYFDETGRHLDIDNITLCSGSRRSDGNVPSVRWSDDRLRVSWYGPSYADSGLRGRAAVTLES